MALQVDIIRDEKAFDALRPEWDALHASSGAPIFQTHIWQRTWWEVYGPIRRDQQLHIMTVRSDGALVAILPLYLERIGFPLLGLDRLRMIGVYETYGEYAILAGPKAGRDAYHELARVLTQILKGPGCDMVSFFRYPPDSAPMNTLIDELKAEHLLGRTVKQVMTRVIMDLPGSWETYIASLSSNERELIRRKTRSLERHGATFEVVLRPDPAAFEDYARLHMASWELRGVAGYFASHHFREFLELVTSRCMANDASRLYFLTKDGVRFAAVHTFTSNGQCCFYLSGLDRKHALAGLSPGTVLLARAIRDAIESKDTLFDFQGGEEEYKFRLGGRRTYFSKTQLFPRDHAGMKVMMFIRTQELYQELYWQITGKIWPGIRTTLRYPFRSTTRSAL